MSPRGIAATLLVTALMGGGPGLAAELVSIEQREVLAWPALALRDGPVLGGEVLASVPYGSEVLVSSEGVGPSETLGGLDGRWRSVRWGLEHGWMFDAWLSPVPVPPRSCPGPAAWAALWRKEGASVEAVTAEGTVEWVQHYRGGMRWHRPADGETAGRLWLAGAALPQAWLGARRCQPHLGAAVEAAWPPRSGSGLVVRHGPDSLELRSSDGSLLLHIEQRAEGTWVSWP